jgi:hypothetical protein
MGISVYQVEAAAKRLGTFTRDYILDAVGVQTYAEGRDVSRILRDLRKCGAVIMADGVMHYVSNDDRNGRLINKIYRAMHRRGVFSRSEVIKLSGVHKSSVRRAFIEIEARGEIERIGMEKGLKGRDEVRYRVCDPDGFYLKYVK